MTVDGGTPAPVWFSVGAKGRGRIAPRGPETHALLVRIFKSDDPALLEEEGTTWRARIQMFRLPIPASLTGSAPIEIEEVLAPGAEA